MTSDKPANRLGYWKYGERLKYVRELRGPCPGWIADHIEPLCAGGADDTANMQWQTVAASKAKDITERATCRALRGAVTKN